LDYKQLERLNLAVARFRELYPDAPLLTFQVFLDVALHPGTSSVDLIRRTGASQSAISRHLVLLSTWTWQGTRPSLELIEMRPNTSARKVPFLTQKGVGLACALMKTVEPELTITAADFATHLAKADH
jgi:hypothetical protein